ncbi:MAG: ferrochelatase [Myxococcales bacterium]|jgi:ferrochelatase
MSEPVETAVVMMNLGGPDSLDAVEPFLFNIFSDPDVVQVPLGFLFQRPLARRIARGRAPTARKSYEQLGGRSPLLELTRRQAARLEERLGPGFKTYVGMRAWHPFIEGAVGAVARDGARRIVALPLYPHHSRTTTGSALRALHRALRARRLELPVHEVCCYPAEPAFIDAWIERIGEALAAIPQERRPTAHLLFSAHGLPRKLVESGDPYLAHLRQTVAAVAARLESPLTHSLAFQSRSTPVEWLSPSTELALTRLGESGVRDVVVAPISFLTDHVETLVELDRDLREHAARSGIDGYHRVGALNDSAKLIEALAGLVRRALGANGRLCGSSPACPRLAA